MILMGLALFVVSFFVIYYFTGLLYSDQTLTISKVFILVNIVLSIKEVQLNILGYYMLLTAGYAIFLVTIKFFIPLSMIVGNIIDVYLFGIIIVGINIILFGLYFGIILISFLLYLFLTKSQGFLLVLLILEAFSIAFQSLTLSNRLSINLLAGSLFINILCVTINLFLFNIVSLLGIVALYTAIYLFEIGNCGIQLFIYFLLSKNYLS